MRISLTFTVLLLGSCAAVRDPAPEDLDGLLRYLFRNFEDPTLVRHGAEGLAEWLEKDGRSQAAMDGYRIREPEREDLEDISEPQRDLADLLGVAVAGVSPHPIETHASILPLEDQMWNDPDGYDAYTRTVVEGDPEAFIAGGDEVLRTVNDIDKKGAFGVNVPYTLHKDYRWVEPRGAGRAIIARSWIEEEGCSASGNNCLKQSFSIDAFHDDDGQDTVRLTASWAELNTQADHLVSDDLRVQLLVQGMLDIFEHTDTFLDDWNGKP